MGGQIEGEGVEVSGAEDFNFDDLEALATEDQEPPKTDSPIEGELQTTDDQAKRQARSIVGLIDMPFKAAGAKPYAKEVYDDGELNIYPAIAQLNLRIPALEVINAVLWVAFRVMESIRELKVIKALKAKKEQEQSSDAV